MPTNASVGLKPSLLFAESAAIKRKLLNVSVSDNRNNQRVAKTFYGYPTEEVEKLYPFITIDLLDVEFAPERMVSELDYYYATDPAADLSRVNTISYYPSELDEAGMASAAGSAGVLKIEQVVPVDLIFQVTTYCRDPRHDLEMQAKILRRVFPMRRGFVDIPEDGTIRRCDLLDWRSANLLDQEAGYKKRVFRKVYTLKINAEFPQSDLLSSQIVTDINGVLKGYNTETVLNNHSFSEEF